MMNSAGPAKCHVNAIPSSPSNIGRHSGNVIAARVNVSSRPLTRNVVAVTANPTPE